jgi:hypothetical protein
MAITPLPAAPETTDTPQQFNSKAFAWVQSLDTFVTEANAQAVTVNSDASDAADAKDDAEAAAAAAVAAANATKWVSGTTYDEGDVVWSPITYLSYRRKSTGGGTTDPSLDSTNWAQVAGTGDVTTTGTQTLTNKTLTAPVVNDGTINRPVITGGLETKVATSGVGSPLTQDIDLDLGNWFTHDLSSNSPALDTTFSVSNVPASGTTAAFILEVINGGSATVYWFSGIEWVGGIAPTLTAAGRDVLGFYTFDGGTTISGFVLGLDVKAP